MGVVYTAEDTRLQRKVAIKFLPGDFDQQADRERFITEARAAAALNSPYIATIHAIEEIDSELFIVMELLEGKTLRQLMDAAEKQDTTLPRDKALDWARQIALGLNAAHEKQIIHCDIKPGNVIITDQEVAKILDFGLAKFLRDTRSEQLNLTMGTIGYMSPEQMRGERLDARTDVWSFGVLLYEMLAGIHPFHGHYEQAIIYAILNDQPKPLQDICQDIPDPIAKLVHRCLEKAPEDRFQSMMEVVKALESKGPVEPLVFALEKKAKPPALAVLPFVDLSPEKDQDYFCDGMTDELIDALTKVKGWRVVSRTSAFTFKGKQLDIRQIGEALNITHAVTGSMRKAGTRLRINAQLIDVTNDLQLWSDRFDRELDDVFAIQEEIARAITGHLKKHLPIEEDTPLFKRYTENIEAYNLYLQARYALNKRTEAGLREGLARCEQALTLDADYAQPYAGLADGYILLSFQGHMPPVDAMPKAQEAALRAVEIDSELAEAHVSLGCIAAVYEWDWPKAKAEFEHAIALSPASGSAHHWYAVWYLMPRGQFTRALIEFMKAQERDPLALIMKVGIGWQFFLSRDYDMAIEQFEKVLEMDANYVVALDLLGQAYAQKSMYPKATAALEKAVKLSNKRTLSYAALGCVYARMGKRQAAEQILQELLVASKQQYVSAYDIALLHACLGESDAAFDWLERAYREHNGWLGFLNVEPRFDGLRSDARFQDMLQRIGLV